MSKSIRKVSFSSKLETSLPLTVNTSTEQINKIDYYTSDPDFIEIEEGPWQLIQKLDNHGKIKHASKSKFLMTSHVFAAKKNLNNENRLSKTQKKKIKKIALDMRKVQYNVIQTSEIRSYLIGLSKKNDSADCIIVSPRFNSSNVITGNVSFQDSKKELELDRNDTFHKETQIQRFISITDIKQ